MNIFSRRTFLSHSAKLGLGAALASLTDIPFVMQRALAEGTIGQPGPNGRVRKLLFIFLRGANDGLNSVIPLGDSAYQTSRPNLAIAPDPVEPYTRVGAAFFPEAGSNAGIYAHPYGLPLGNGFAALHPSLKFLAPLYNSGDLALIHRVGYPKQSRSHFDSQAYWENGAPADSAVKDGLLYRAMIESGLANTSPLTAISIGSSLPLILRGSKAAMTNISDPNRYALLSVPNTPAANAKANAALAAANTATFADKRERELLQLQYKNLHDTLELFAQLKFSEADNTFRDEAVTDGDTDWANANGGGYYLFPTTPDKNGGWRRGTGNRADKYVIPTSGQEFFERLKAAAIILNQTDAIVAGVSIDGWDTHSDQVQAKDEAAGVGSHTGTHAGLLRRVGWSLYALQKYFTRYAAKCRWDDLAVVTLSEFGRTTIENSDAGTDHAEASVMFVAGGNIKGYEPGTLGGVKRTGVFNCGGDGDRVLPWATGPTGSLFRAGDRYLQRNTDYRSVLGKIIRDHLGASPDQLTRIIPGYANSSESLKTPGLQARDNTQVIGEPDIV
ncbi:MAG TPA: DUF1501 domain-containing protein [Verrucomicrobiota bacterium]|nr:DUF1501 domain-containing protein [Verrucomicrobiota bacterium]